MTAFLGEELEGKLTNELSKYIARFKIETSKNANKESKEKLSTKKRSLLEKQSFHVCEDIVR